ncbi:MAG TPA: phosphotransferase [Candidatus Limnocylindria bacterium]|nr:phosphotransferase [Candidatus Limnocylindria bacterium]
MDGPDELAPVLALLPETARELRQLAGPRRPWFVRYGSREAVLRPNDPARFRGLHFKTELALTSIGWLHRFLRDLASGGFTAPAPIEDLNGQSIAVVDGTIWELLSFVPGQPMGWTDIEIHEAGGLLARFHEASRATPRRAQRPGSTPVEDCRPEHTDARRLRSRFEDELANIDHHSARRAVVHGDATQSNVVAEGQTFHLVDFALAYDEAVLFDLGSALWRNGRSSPDAITYDPRRAATFVRGYAAVRPLSLADGHAIVVYMKGRGLQLQHRLELREGRDDTVMQRLLSIDAQQSELEHAIAEALESGHA